MNNFVTKIKKMFQDEPRFVLAGITAEYIDYLIPINNDEPSDAPDFFKKYHSPLSFFYRSAPAITAPFSLIIATAFSALVVALYLGFMIYDAITLNFRTMDKHAEECLTWFKMTLACAIGAILSPIIELTDSLIGGLNSLKNDAVVPA